MHLVTKAFRSVVSKNSDFLSNEKRAWYEQIFRIIEQAHSTGYKDFLEVLLLMREYSLEEVSQAITAIGPTMSNVVSLRQYLAHKPGQESTRTSIDYLTASATQLITTIDTYQYDQLLRGVS